MDSIIQCIVFCVRFPLALPDDLLSSCLTGGLSWPLNMEQQEISGTCLLFTVIQIGVRGVSCKKRYLKLYLSLHNILVFFFFLNEPSTLCHNRLLAAE